jgi:hypothetical protein
MNPHTSREMRIYSDCSLPHTVSNFTVYSMETRIIGQDVIVKDFMGRAFVKKVWITGNNSVFITSENGFKRLSKGEKTPWPIGIPLEDVYEYDGQPLPEKVNWDRMVKWTLK